jgi:hypothetical protein
LFGCHDGICSLLYGMMVVYSVRISKLPMDKQAMDKGAVIGTSNLNTSLLRRFIEFRSIMSSSILPVVGLIKPSKLMLDR